jgi:excisionase family DNA binding protein
MAAELAELEKRLFSVENVMQMLNVGRTKVYNEMDSGRLRSVKVGRRRLVTAAALDEFIAKVCSQTTPDEEPIEAEIVEPASVDTLWTQSGGVCGRWCSMTPTRSAWWSI